MLQTAHKNCLTHFLWLFSYSVVSTRYLLTVMIIIMMMSFYYFARHVCPTVAYKLTFISSTLFLANISMLILILFFSLRWKDSRVNCFCGRLRFTIRRRKCMKWERTTRRWSLTCFLNTWPNTSWAPRCEMRYVEYGSLFLPWSNNFNLRIMSLYL